MWRTGPSAHILVAFGPGAGPATITRGGKKQGYFITHFSLSFLSPSGSWWAHGLTNQCLVGVLEETLHVLRETPSPRSELQLNQAAELGHCREWDSPGSPP
jgi:hypothetical protein